MGNSDRVLKIWTNAYNLGLNHLLLTKDTSRDQTSFKLYLNNNEVTTISGTPTNGLISELAYTSIPNVKIGVDTAISGRESDMIVWDMKWYRKLLSPTERLNNFITDSLWVPDTSIIKTKTGTITATAGSITVTGSGTLFTDECTVGEALFTDGLVFIGNITSINSNTSITLNSGALNSHSGAFKHGSLVSDLRQNQHSGPTVIDSSGLGLDWTKTGSGSTVAGSGNNWKDIYHNPWML
jgi:hypothetical protein